MYGDGIMGGEKVMAEVVAGGAGTSSATEQGDLDESPVVLVAVASLSVADSPRTAGENAEHVEALAAAQAKLPPIIVHHPTMQVIDGVHRLKVARLLGQERIAARFFYGDEADAFVLAVQSNVTHGLPLSLTDRKSAARRIVVSHPPWSDRKIGSVTGLSPKTVADIRRRQLGEAAAETVRIGRDGRTRPINGSEGRRLASELIKDNPDLSLRQIARAVGISPETARDVRNRLSRGENPVPVKRERSQPIRGVRRNGRPAEVGGSAGLTRLSSKNPIATYERLRADPALRFSETGRILLRLLHVHLVQVEEWERIGENVPPHCSGIVSNLAKECAQMWQELAEVVERKIADIA